MTKQFKLWLFSIALSLVTVAGFSQTQTLTVDRVFTASKTPTEATPTWSSKFGTGDLIFCTKDTTIYVYDATTKKWNPKFYGNKTTGGSGSNGVSVTNTTIDINGDLIVTLSNGNTINAGHVVGQTGSQGPAGPAGATGPAGASVTGPAGPTGPQGPTGPAGVGPSGPAGPQGIQGIAGRDGVSPANPNFSTTTTTLAPGASATSSITGAYPNLVVNFGIPAGKDGTSGSGGGSAVYGSFPVFVQSPEFYRPQHSTKTFAQAGYTQMYIDTAFAGAFKTAGATLTDNVDWACWQAAFNACPSGGRIQGYGTYYFNKGVNVPFMKHLDVSGGIFWSSNLNTYTFFYRPMPTDGNDAMIKAIYKIYWSNMTFMGNGNTMANTAIDINACFGARYDNIVVENMYAAINLTFQINVLVSNCYATGCVRGWTCDYIPTLNPAIYQSNHVEFYGCRFYGLDRNGTVSGSEYAFKFVAVSGCKVTHSIIEGKSVQNGILFDGQNSTVVKDFTVSNTHFECEKGADNAFLKVNMREGIVKVSCTFGQYATLLADINAQAGVVSVVIEDMPYFVGRADGKYFKSAGQCQWAFRNNVGQFFDRKNRSTGADLIGAMFVDNNVGYCGSALCGASKYTFEPVAGSNY